MGKMPMPRGAAVIDRRYRLLSCRRVEEVVAPVAEIAQLLLRGRVAEVAGVGTDGRGIVRGAAVGAAGQGPWSDQAMKMAP